MNAGTHTPLIHNVRLVNAGEQFVKSNPDAAGVGVDNGIVGYSVIEYDTTSRDDYTNGVDVHGGTNWMSATTCSATSARRRVCSPGRPS